MQVYALEMDDFSEEPYSLIGIHSTLEDYKLAYLINRNLNTRFDKATKDLEFKRDQKKASFSIYNYENTNDGFDWFLIANSYRRENQTVSNELLLTSETKTYLISEKKKVDYFIKIVGEPTQETIYKTVHQIKQINQVVTSYTVELDSLKSKQFLIF